MELRKAGKVRYIDPTLLTAADVSVQGFTTRHEGVSRPPYNSLNLGTNTLDAEHSVMGNRSILVRAFGTRQERLLTVNQVHGTDLLVIDTPNVDVSHFASLECDGIVTNQPGMMIGICVADCVPVLLLDPVQRVAAALHAGWKGTAGRISSKGVESLVSLFGSRPADILAAIGPGIGPCCYQVDEPVRAAFEKGGTLWEAVTTTQSPGTWGLDIAAANLRQLIEAGLQERHIQTSGDCVSCRHDSYFSYRRDKGETGRQMGFIMLR